MTRIIGIMPIDLTAPLVFYKKRSKGFDVASQSDVASASQLIILVPSTDVTIHTVSLPMRNEAEARRAAPFAIEDELAVPAEDVHIALGVKKSGDSVRGLHVCAPEMMDAWLARIADNKMLRSAHLVADASVIPDGQFAIEFGDRILGRAGSRIFTLDASIPDDVLNALFSSSKSKLTVLGKGLASRMSEVTASDLDPTETVLSWAAGSENLIDLRQGKFAQRRRGDFNWAAWRLPVGLAAATTFAWLSALALENRALGQLTDQMTSASRSIYTTAFPNEPVPRNIMQAVRSPDGAQGSVEFRSASAVLYSGVEAIGSPGIQSLRYDEAGGTMRARITFQNFGDEQRLKEHIENAGVIVQIGEMRQQAGRVTGELTMELAQ